MLNAIAKKFYFAINRLTKLTPDAYYLNRGISGLSKPGGAFSDAFSDAFDN